MKTMTFHQGMALWCDPAVTPRYYEAVQRFINEGHFSTGSDCTRNYDGIESGKCLWPKKAFKGYVYIPSRDEVMAGTPGTYDFVAKLNGKEYADAMAALDGFDGMGGSINIEPGMSITDLLKSPRTPAAEKALLADLTSA